MCARERAYTHGVSFGASTHERRSSRNLLSISIGPLVKQDKTGRVTAALRRRLEGRWRRREFARLFLQPWGREREESLDGAREAPVGERRGGRGGEHSRTDNASAGKIVESGYTRFLKNSNQSSILINARLRMFAGYWFSRCENSLEQGNFNGTVL